MKIHPVTEQDEQLVAQAKEFIDKNFREDWHHIGVAVRTKAGSVYTAFNLDTYVGGRAVCAEPIAIGQALSSGEYEIEAVVAVRKPRPNKRDPHIRVVSPCGGCRELITDYAPDAWVILEDDDGNPFKVKATELLPEKYAVGKRKQALK